MRVVSVLSHFKQEFPNSQTVSRIISSDLTSWRPAFSYCKVFIWQCYLQDLILIESSWLNYLIYLLGDQQRIHLWPDLLFICQAKMPHIISTSFLAVRMLFVLYDWQFSLLQFGMMVGKVDSIMFSSTKLWWVFSVVCWGLELHFVADALLRSLLIILHPLWSRNI